MMTDLNNNLGFIVADGNAGHLAFGSMTADIPGMGAPGIYQPLPHNKTPRTVRLKERENASD